MAKRISELPTLDTPEADAGILVEHGGQNYRLPVGKILDEITAERVGLGHVDNTADADKPVSTAQQQALDGKVAVDHQHTLDDLLNLVDLIEDKVADAVAQYGGGGGPGLQKAEW